MLPFVYFLLINQFLYTIDYSINNGLVEESLIDLVHENITYDDMNVLIKGKSDFLSYIKIYSIHEGSSIFNHYSFITSCTNNINDETYIYSRIGNSLLPKLNNYNLPRPGIIETIHGDYVSISIKNGKVYSFNVFDVYSLTINNVTLPISTAYYNLSGSMFLSSVKYTEIARYVKEYKKYKIHFNSCIIES